jgi:hypothetical protein
MAMGIKGKGFFVLSGRNLVDGNRPMQLAPRLLILTGSIALTFGIMTKPALADHSLAIAMNDNITLANAVAQISATHRVVCDVENSNQTYYYPAEQGQAGTAWKQIALCFPNETAMLTARQYFQKGGELGFYGAPGVVGVLVVAYTWEDYKAARIISIEYR